MLFAAYICIILEKMHATSNIILFKSQMLLHEDNDFLLFHRKAEQIETQERKKRTQKTKLLHRLGRVHTLKDNRLQHFKLEIENLKSNNCYY